MDVMANTPNKKKNMIMLPLPTTYAAHIKDSKESKVKNLNSHDKAPIKNEKTI